MKYNAADCAFGFAGLRVMNRGWRSLRFGLVAVLLVSAVAALSGCAYHAGTVDRQIPGGYREIAVPVFRNPTPETGVEVYFTNAFIRKLERARIGRVTDKAHAQVTLEGNIDSIQYFAADPGELDPKGFIATREYRIFIQTSMVLRRNSDQRVLWQGTFNKEGTYPAPRIRAESLNSANALYNHSARYQNIQALAIDMMAEAHDRLTENF